MDGPNEIVDEQTPLLKSPKPECTPIPKLQITIVLLLQLCEPICSQSLNPYVNELISSLDIIRGDTQLQKVEPAARLIESLYFLAEAVTVLQWIRLSDHIGRKLVLLLGMLGVVMSMLFFGLSRTFVTLVISRCLCGLLNGNIGVIKSMMVELTDNTNRADVFGFITPVSAFGAIIGPLLGTLARPSDRFPATFSGGFWSQFPYFLPCLATSTFVSGAVLVTLVFFKETLSTRKPILQAFRSFWRSRSESSSNRLRLNAEVSLQNVLSFPVFISITNYATLVFLNILIHSLLPLFFSMPTEMGGLGMGSDVIGFMRGVYVAGTGVFQFLYFARLVRSYGTRRVFILAMATFLPIFLCLPLVTILAKMNSPWAVWILSPMMMFLLLLTDTANGCILICIIECAPNPRSVRYVNGLAQTTASIVRAIGPALSTSLFRFATQSTSKFAWEYGIYVILAFLATLALCLATNLPQLPRPPVETDDKVAIM